MPNGIKDYFKIKYVQAQKCDYNFIEHIIIMQT